MDVKVTMIPIGDNAALVSSDMLPSGAYGHSTALKQKRQLSRPVSKHQ